MGRTSAKVVIFPQIECDGEGEKDGANRVSTAYRWGKGKKQSQIVKREDLEIVLRLFHGRPRQVCGRPMDAINHCVLHYGHQPDIALDLHP